MYYGHKFLAVMRLWLQEAFCPRLTSSTTQQPQAQPTTCTPVLVLLRPASCKEALCPCCRTLISCLSSGTRMRQLIWPGSTLPMGTHLRMSSRGAQCLMQMTLTGERVSLSPTWHLIYFCTLAMTSVRLHKMMPPLYGLLHRHATHFCRYIHEAFPHVVVQPSDGRFPVLPLFQIMGCGTRCTLIIPLASSVAGNAHLAMTVLSKGATAAVSPLQIRMLRGLVDTVLASYASVNNRAAKLTSPVRYHAPAEEVRHPHAAQCTYSVHPSHSCCQLSFHVPFV